MLDLDERWPFSENLATKKHETAGKLYHFDVRADSAIPDAKLCIPVRHFAPKDLAIATGLTSYLKAKGRDRFAASYTRELKQICMHRSLANRCGLQIYTSCAERGAELVMTSCMSPEVYHSVRW